jgi:anti-sigma factor RsiW
MLRLLGAVLLGYLAMAALVFAGLSAGYAVLGAERAFRPDAYEVSINWALLSVAVGFVAAVAGGWISRRVGGDLRGPALLASFVGLLGLMVAVTSLADRTEPATPRTGSPAMFEAMEQARTPAWLLVLNPLVGVAGVVIGGGLLLRR